MQALATFQVYICIMRIKQTPLLGAVIISAMVTISACSASGNSGEDVSLSACKTADAALSKASDDFVNSLSLVDKQYKISQVQSTFSTLSSALMELAGSANGDVAKALKDASDAASKSSDDSETIDEPLGQFSSDMDYFSSIVGQGKNLDAACQVLGAPALTVNW